MRAIKFRSWDKERKKMFSVKHIAWGDEKVKHIGLKGTPQEQEIYPIPIKNLIIMQYTGLRDKSGKEIYEGDIIDSLYNIPSNIHNHPLLIEDIRDLPDPNIYINLPPPSLNTWEVIGNIYENPELMENRG